MVPFGVLPNGPSSKSDFGDGVSPSQVVDHGNRVSIITSNSAIAARGNHKPDFISFNRVELDLILNAYGKKVVSGEWRDYAIDTLKDRAVFSVFRRSSEMPIYRIEKNPKLARKQGAYSVVSTSGLVMKRGADLKNVLRVFEKNSRVVEL